LFRVLARDTNPQYHERATHIRLYPPTPSRYDAAGVDVRQGGPIMRRCILAFACLSASAHFADAQTFDKAAFRQAIAMPAIATNFGVAFKASERDGKERKRGRGSIHTILVFV
jgi:hypothetical protein